MQVAGESSALRRRNVDEQKQVQGGGVGAAGGAGGGGQGASKVERKGEPNEFKLAAGVLIVPIVLLLIMYPTLRYIYYKPEEIRPCSGVCNLTDADIASAPEGCKPSNPNRLFYIQIPRTASKSMHKAMLARRLDKGWTSVSVKDWRDASMWLPVFANKMHKSSRAGYYEESYAQQTMMTIFPNRSTRALIAGKTFLYNLHDRTKEWQKKASSEMSFFTMFRDPADRLRSQYKEFVDFEAKRAKHFGDTSVKFYTFEECVSDRSCKAEKKFAQWCSLQTAMMCGWEKECTPGPGGNATVQMLEKSKENLRTRMGAFGLFEKFESTIKVVGERLPAYFEGIHQEVSGACPGGTGPGVAEECKYTTAQIDPGTPPVSDDIRNLLKDECWADTLLYQYASSMFEEQAKACGA